MWPSSHLELTPRTIVHHIRHQGSHFLYISWVEDHDTVTIIYDIVDDLELAMRP